VSQSAWPNGFVRSTGLISLTMPDRIAITAQSRNKSCKIDLASAKVLQHGPHAAPPPSPSSGRGAQTPPDGEQLCAPNAGTGSLGWRFSLLDQEVVVVNLVIETENTKFEQAPAIFDDLLFRGSGHGRVEIFLSRHTFEKAFDDLDCCYHVWICRQTANFRRIDRHTSSSRRMIDGADARISRHK
jgi:hypothetical protein